MSKKKKVSTGLLLIFLIPVAIFILGFFWWSSSFSAVSSDETSQSFVIPKGRSAIQVGNLLHDEGLIKSPLAFKVYVQVTGSSGNVQAGQYLLSPNLSLSEIVDKLTGGPVGVWVTIPEGLRREEVAERFVQSLELRGQEAEVFINEFMVLSEGQEGYLFPDTYLFQKGTDASKVVSVLSNTFDSRTSDLTNLSGYVLSDVIIMASLLERETITVEEKPIVAGILYKRLEADWPLQVDAAVQYAIASLECEVNLQCAWWPILTRADLDSGSPFNTYKFPGLPPAPISGAGLSSIEAAANPETSTYWFYIHDPEGKIHYAETIEEHNRNIARYLGK